MAESTPGPKPESQVRGAEPADTERVDRARRLLLRGAVYAAPLVIGLVDVATAKAQPVSCPPATCAPNPCAPHPCLPVSGPCGPNSCKPGN